MCGLTGFVDFRGDRAEADLAALARAMARRIEHRGPDDSGEWADAATGVAFGFRRLAIIDLSEAGHQPMLSASGRFVIQFNGEVYNFESIRQELENERRAPAWRGHSDTEVMLAAIEAWGVVAAVRRFVGMFAIALYDRKARKLFLIRDRFGVKPLYFGWCGDVFLFGSELKALRAHPSFEGRIDRNALALYMRHNYIPEPWSIYESIGKLRPGCILSISCESFESARRSEVLEPYWSARDAVERARCEPFRGDGLEAADRLEELLRDAVGLRMISDVPLGVFLSGGVDSSIVAAMMQVQSSRPVRTFSIGFHEEGYDEAEHARRVAEHLGTDHTELYLTGQQALDVLPMLPSLYDEPFADSSQIPTFLVSQMARRHVTVSLSGDGGDELFGGYNRYFLGGALWRRVGWVPGSVRKRAARAIESRSLESWESFFSIVGALLPSSMLPQRPAEKLMKATTVMSAESADEMYRMLISQWRRPDEVVFGSHEVSSALSDASRHPVLADFTERMMFLDSISYLPDDILVKVDRASMGVGLEAREPLLDHRLYEFAWTLPLEMKVAGREGKKILREVLCRHVPITLIDRPKMGFGIPVDRWLRGPLRDWAEDLLSEERIRRGGLLDANVIRDVWSRFLGGSSGWQYHLWTVIVFQQWLQSGETERG